MDFCEYTTQQMDRSHNVITRGFWTAMNALGTLVVLAKDMRRRS